MGPTAIQRTSSRLASWTSIDRDFLVAFLAFGVLDYDTFVLRWDVTHFELVCGVFVYNLTKRRQDPLMNRPGD